MSGEEELRDTARFVMILAIIFAIAVIGNALIDVTLRLQCIEAGHPCPPKHAK